MKTATRLPGPRKRLLAGRSPRAPEHSGADGWEKQRAAYCPRDLVCAVCGGDSVRRHTAGCQCLRRVRGMLHVVYRHELTKLRTFRLLC